MAVIDLPKPDFVRNMRLLGWSDQGGRLDGVQIMVHRGYAYIGHMFSKGFSVVDVRDPAKPRAAGYFPSPHNSWNIHLQAHDDLLLVIHAKDMFADAAFADEHAYYKGTIGHAVGTAHGSAGRRDWSAGLAVYDIARPEAPRQIGFLPVDGGGIHRIWYVGGRWAYASALIDGFSDYILITIDMADPEKPREAGRFWLPGMNLAAGEAPNWPATTRMGLHHAVVHDDIAYGAWRDGCLAVIDVADRTAPKLIVHKSWAPPFGGGTHNCLPLADRELLIVVDEAVLDHQEDGMKPIWVFDNRRPANPVSIATFPNPTEADYVGMGGHFGPHNIHENRPGSFVSSELIFATYQNAGVRVFDIRDPYRPVEVAALVPPPPTKMMDHRPNRVRVIQTADVFVDRNGIAYATDYNAGLTIMEYTG
ncbi:MAG: LVIVD repeat-containing protein [Acetobacteraceae bacterium]